MVVENVTLLAGFTKPFGVTLLASNHVLKLAGVTVHVDLAFGGTGVCALAPCAAKNRVTVASAIRQSIFNFRPEAAIFLSVDVGLVTRQNGFAIVTSFPF